MPWYDYLAKDAYQRWFDKPRFEEATEPKASWLSKAYETFRKGAEAVEPEPTPPMERFREVEREMQPAVPERAPVIPSAEEVVASFGAVAGRLRERAGGLGIERLAGTATQAEMRRAKGQVPAVVGAGFAYEPEVQAHAERLTEQFQQAHPEWSQEEIEKAVMGVVDPGEGFMPMAAWGLAMRPAMAAMAIAGGKAAAPAARATVAEAGRVIPKAKEVTARLLTEEAGGLKPRPKPLWEPEAMRVARPPAPTVGAKPKYVLTNDIRTLAEINKRLGQLSKVEKMTAKQMKERARLLSEKDLHDLRAAGTVDDQMDNLLEDILEMEKELELRAVRQEYKPARAPQYGTAERVDWEAARAGRPHGYRPETRYSGEPIEFLRERVKVYREFRDEMKIMPAGEEVAEEALVTRARFTERGEVIKEPTFATEGELAGIRPVQGELGIGAGQRPIETAGPMFQRAAPEAAGARARITSQEVFERPWEFTASQYQGVQGVHAPWIGEISGVQRKGMSKAALARYDATRRAEWQASGAIKDEWKAKVLAAYDEGRITLDTPMHQEAKSAIQSGLRRRGEEATEVALKKALGENAIRSVDDVAVGDRVFDIGTGRYATVQKKFKTSVRVNVEGSPLPGGRNEYTISARQLQWQHYNDVKAAVEAGEAILPARPAAPAAPKPAAQAFREATEVRPKAAALEEAPAWELGGMGTVEEMAGITETTAKANTGRLRALSGARGEKPPPGKPPTATEPPSASDDILDYMLGAPKDEKLHRTLIRRYEGQVRVELDEADVLLRNILIDARKGGVKLSRTRTPEMERLIEAVDFQGPTEQAVRGLSVEEANLVRALHRIRDSETAKMLRDIPDFQARDFYWPHEYKLPKKPIKVPGRMQLGQKPGFMRQRKLEGTILENLAEKPNLDLVTWDPIEMIQRRIYNGVQYRQQFTLLNHMKRQGLALRRSKAPTEGWRTPKDVTAFNPRAVPGKPEVFTEPWLVPQDIAKAIEDHFGSSLFSSNVPLRALRETVATLKFVKTFGGLFQHFDYTLRVMANATKYRDVSTLGTIPRAWGRGYLPGLNAKMKAWDLKNPIRVALKKHGLNVQSGMDFQGREYTQLAREMKLFKIPIIGRVLKNFGSATFRNAHEEYLLGTGEGIVKNRMAGGMSLDQAAAQTALDMNEVFSALPNWQSVLRNPTTRDITRVGVFSMAEQESWIRMPIRQKTFLASIVLTTAGLSNMVSLVTTGKMLPLDAYKPFNIDPENRDIEYNVGFLRPELPYEGPDGRIEYLDILGQADTPFRFLGSPQFAIESRLGQIPGSALQAYRGRTWFGEKEISGPKELGLFAAEQISPIPAAPYWEERGRIGTVGAIIQSIGLNVSAERLGSLFRRRFQDLTGEDWDKLDPSARKTYINQHPELLKLQAKRIEAGERYGGGWAQVDALDRDIEVRLTEAITSGQVTGEQVRDEFKDYQTQRSWLSQQTAAEWGEPEAKTPAHAAALEYWAIEVPIRNGVKDWETFFAERKKVRDAHPELTDEWLRANLAERFHEPQVRDLVYQILEADAIADEYYSIPYKDELPAEFQDAVREYVEQAQSIASLQGIPFEEALMQTGISPSLIDLAVEYKKAPINPFRAVYFEQYPEKKARFFTFYRDIPLGIEQPEMAMAGVP